MQQQKQELLAWVTGLSGHPEPVTFLDITMVVRHLRGLADLGPVLSRALLQLHEAPCLTDGARQVLTEFLQAYASRVDAEQRLAAKILGLNDSGKTVRALPGHRLKVKLPLADPQRRRWGVHEQRGVVRVQALRPIRAQAPEASFEVHLTAAGQGYVMLEEQDIRSATPTPSRPRKTFELYVLATKR